MTGGGNGGSTRLAARFAARELRGGLKGFRVFIACLVLGVAAIAAVGTARHGITAGIERDARLLLGGDVELELNNAPANAGQMAWLRTSTRAVSHVMDLRSMARTVDNTARTLIQLKAVDGAYPLVGDVVLRDGGTLTAALANTEGEWGAAVDPVLLDKLGLAVGDRLQIGDGTFRIRAAVEREPDRVASIFRYGPRVLLSTEAMPATQLLRPGVQVEHEYRAVMTPGIGVEAWVAETNERFPEAGWRIRRVSDAAPGVRRFIERMALFLSFVGLSTLLVGGIGVSNAIASYLDGRTATIATLKCLGASGGLVVAVYLIQVLALAAAGIVGGIAIGTAGALGALSAAAPMLPVRPVIAVDAGALATAAVFGGLVAVTFAMWPLARTHGVAARTLFRSRVESLDGRPPRRYVVACVLGAALLGGLVIATASERYFAYWFVGGAVVTLGLLRLAAVLVVRLARRAPASRDAVRRMAIANLHRPGNATGSVLPSVGAGLAVLIAVVLIQQNLTAQVDERLPETAPAFFFLDIQPDQVAAFDDAVTSVQGVGNYQRVPSLRGRIVRIDGTPVSEADVEPEAEWAIRGDRALTYAAEPRTDAPVVAGEWWPAGYDGPPLISFERDLARGFGVEVGDTLTVNVLGRDITATIANLREIDWRSLQFDFAIVFAPGTLEGAPQTHIAAIEAPKPVENIIERRVSERFTNVTAIRVRDALAEAARLLAGIGAAARGAAGVTLAAGVLVLAGVMAATRRRRIRDAVILKVLGATRRWVLGTYLWEYGLLGGLTALAAAGIGWAVAWGVVVHLMRMAWVPFPGLALAVAAGGVALTLVVGFVGTWQVLGQKAAPYLRNE